MFPLSVCEFVPLLLVLCVILITLLLGSQAILAPLSEMQAEDEEKTIGFQTTHLPKFHTITYSLKNQLCLIWQPPICLKRPKHGTTHDDDDCNPPNQTAEEGQEEHDDHQQRLEKEENLFRDYYTQLITYGDFVDRSEMVNKRSEEINVDLLPTATSPRQQEWSQQQCQRPSLQLRFLLRFKTEAERLRDESMLGTALGKTLPSRLFTLVLHFVAPSKIYEPLEDVHIPYLCRSNESELQEHQKESRQYVKGKEEQAVTAAGGSGKEDNEDGERIPFSYDITLTLRPLVPLPATFTVKATFNDEKGNICEGELEPLCVHFTDLFLPLPFPPAFSVPSSPPSLSSSPFLLKAEEVSSAPSTVFLCAMWRQLWRRIELPGLGLSPSQPAEGYPCCCLSWPFCCDMLS